MGHVNSVLMAVSKCPNPTTFQKTLGVNDYYVPTAEWDYPMGHISFVGKLDGVTLSGGRRHRSGITLDLMGHSSTSGSLRGSARSGEPRQPRRRGTSFFRTGRTTRRGTSAHPQAQGAMRPKGSADPEAMPCGIFSRNLRRPEDSRGSGPSVRDSAVRARPEDLGLIRTASARAR
jgi:hypothetical protein